MDRKDEPIACCDILQFNQDILDTLGLLWVPIWIHLDDAALFYCIPISCVGFGKQDEFDYDVKMYGTCYAGAGRWIHIEDIEKFYTRVGFLNQTDTLEVRERFAKVCWAVKGKLEHNTDPPRDYVKGLDEIEAIAERMEAIYK